MKYIEKVDDFYSIIELKEFRKTEGVRFDILDTKDIGNIVSIDRVLHKSNAISPGPINGVERPWYMHPAQDDNLMVLYGVRDVDIYHPKYGIKHFTVTPDKIYKDGKLFYDGPALLVWPRKVFHRIVSGEEGSASLNLAVRYENFDIKTNFNIYDVDLESGEYWVIREGYKDQK